MSLMWFLLGALIVLFIMVLRNWIAKNRVKLAWSAWLGIILDAFLFFFTIAWCVTSIIEGENRAAFMGFLIIGLPALILFVLTVRKVKKDIKGS